MKKAKASKPSAVTQPETVSTLIGKAPLSLLSRSVPYDDQQCVVVCDWDAFDGTWEQLLVNRAENTFYLNSSRTEENPVQILTSEALYWYATKRELDCDYGSLGWPGLGELLTRAVNELHFAETVIGKRGAK